MKKPSVLLLAGNTMRARAYAQILELLDKDLFTIRGLFYGFETSSNSFIEINNNTREYFKSQNLFLPDFNENIKETFSRNEWFYSEVETRDVNHSSVIEEMDKMDCDIIVFAGYGGQILKPPHFTAQAKYLHMHPGNLPEERGSTTIYYSILNQKKCTVTAFYMTEKIDDGQNLLKCTYLPPEKHVDVDVCYDNVIRADCFKNALVHLSKGSAITCEDSPEDAEYYVIHPVLKHVALLSLNER